MTKEEFEAYYANNTKVTVEQLRTKYNRAAIPCDCDYEDCRGWQMVHVETAQAYYQNEGKHGGA